MPLQIQLKGVGPGRGVFEISGGRIDGQIGVDAVELAVQRNADDKFLGPDLVWQSSIHWHWCARVDADTATLRLDAGPEIVDGVLGSSVNAMLVEVRAGGRRDSGILRIHGLVGSPAGAERVRPRPAQAAPSRATPVPGEPPASSVNGRRSFPGWLLFALVAAGIGLAALGTAWQLGVFDLSLAPAPRDFPAAPAPGPGLQAPSGVPGGEPATSESVPAPLTGERASQEPSLRGRAMVQRYLATNPSAEGLYAEAQSREALGDCEAAILLFERAAAADPMIAARVAGRYDPVTFEPSRCIALANRESALVWYEDAARAGDRESQRRLGQMLIEQADSGVLHEEGRDWLRKAADGGDPEARRLFEGLERPQGKAD
jgi:hypothetical protein